MRMIIFYCTLLFLFTNSLLGQSCPCPGQYVVGSFTLIPGSHCCYTLSLNFGDRACAAANYNQITVDPKLLPSQSALITSAVGTAPFNAIVNSAQNLAIFTTALPAPWLNQGQVGQICFANATSSSFIANVVVSNSSVPAPDTCALSFINETLSADCIIPSCCQPLVQLTPDLLDTCCHLINVSFPNPAGCTLPTGFNRITVGTNGTNAITGVNGSGVFSPTLNTPNLATFMSATGITPFPQAVGKVCFASTSPAAFPVQLVISNSTVNPDTCAKSFSYSVSTPCKNPCSISIADEFACTTDETISVPLLGCSSITCVTQVRWYVQSPCVNGTWTLYQVKSDCSPLLLLPNQYSSDICVYAEVQTDGICSCPLITSNIATIQLCNPVSCSISPNTIYEYCDSGTPPLLTALVSGSTTGCLYTVAWYDGQNNVVGNAATYTPPPLIFQGLPTDCYQDYVYKAVVTSACGQSTCTTSYRVYNSAAPKGKIDMLPVEPQPFCHGEDATLTFTPGCAGDPKMWEWWRRLCTGSNPVPAQLVGSGTMNPLFQTNKLYQSWWYYVKTTNGVCPFDTVQLKIEVKKPVAINWFTAVPDSCVEQQVVLTLDFQPCTIEGCGTNCTCTHTVEWYQDGFIIAATNNVTGTQASYTNTTLPLAGNYYAVLRSDCCPGDTLKSALVAIRPSCVPQIKGPCFICNGVPVTLIGSMSIPPREPCPDFCTFEWCELINGVCGPVLGTGTTLTVNHAGTYVFTSNCNGCIKSDTFVLPECNNPCSCGSLQWAQFWQPWSFNQPITCNNAATPVIAPCPKQGTNYFIIGSFTCAPNSCGNTTVNWELTRPSLPSISGVSTATYPFFVAILPWAQCVQPGIYTLKITRNCGIVPCTCTFTFVVPNCGCLCTDLDADANQSFNIAGRVTNCVRSFKPLALDPCDQVTWSIDGTILPGTSTGNNAFTYNFVNPGTHVVCMNVTRTPITGPPCSLTKCRTIIVNCFSPHLGYGYCPNPKLRNGNFTEELVAGRLGIDGQAADWLPLPGMSEGLIFVDSSAGAYDNGYLVLAGRSEHPATIFQSVNLVPDSFTVIEYNRRNFSGAELLVGTKLEFRLYADSSATAENQLIYTDLIEGSIDTGWIARSASIEISTNPEFPYLVVSVTNEDQSGGQSVIGLDNLEMCTSPTSNTAAPAQNQVFRLFPNPTTNEITIEWSGFEAKNGSVQIVSSLGQILRTISISDNSNRLTTTVAHLPEGIYFVKILSSGRQMKVMKFVKS